MFFKDAKLEFEIDCVELHIMSSIPQFLEIILKCWNRESQNESSKFVHLDTLCIHGWTKNVWESVYNITVSCATCVVGDFLYILFVYLCVIRWTFIYFICVFIGY